MATVDITIQVLLAAIVDSIIPNAPNFLDYLGATAVVVGFAGIDIPMEALFKPKEATMELEKENLSSADQDDLSSICKYITLSLISFYDCLLQLQN